MTSQRRDVELKERGGFVDVPLGDPLPQRSTRLQPGRLWSVILGVCGVALVASVATLAIMMSGSSGPAPLQKEDTPRESHYDPQLNERVGPTSLFSLTKQLTDRFSQFSAGMNFKASFMKEKGGDASEFEEVEVPLGEVEGLYEGERPPPHISHQQVQEPQHPPDPNFQEVEVPLDKIDGLYHPPVNPQPEFQEVEVPLGEVEGLYEGERPSPPHISHQQVQEPQHPPDRNFQEVEVPLGEVEGLYEGERPPPHISHQQVQEPQHPPDPNFQEVEVPLDKIDGLYHPPVNPQPEFQEVDVPLGEVEGLYEGERPSPPHISHQQVQEPQHPPDRNFQEVEVLLGEVEGLYEGERPPPPPHISHQQVQEPQHPPDPKFQQVQVPVEKVHGVYKGNRPPPPLAPHPKVKQPKQPLDPDFQEKVKIETPQEHDGSRLPKLLQQRLAHRQKTGKVKESTRLPTRLENAQRICETPECAIAATQISENLDLSVDPCDNFYEFACGGWINKHPIPPSGVTGTFEDAGEKLEKRLFLILDSPAEPDAPQPLHMIRTYYNTCMDTDTMNSLGFAPLALVLEHQGGWPLVLDAWDPSAFTLTTAINNLRDLNAYPLLGVGVDADVEDVSTKILYLDIGTVPLGINVISHLSKEMLDIYKTYITDTAKLLRDDLGTLVSDEQIQKEAEEIVEFELAFSQMVFKALANITDHIYRTNIKEVQEMTDAGTPGVFNWLAFMKEMFTNTDVTITEDEPLISFNGPFFSMFSNLLAATEPRILANAIGWWWAYELQDETTYVMRNVSIQFFHDLFGEKLPTQRQHCLDQTNANMGFAMSREYVDRFMAGTVKPEVSELVEDIRKAYDSLLDENTWMLPEDLAVAKEKLAAIDPFVAYPDWIMDDEELTLGYEDLDITYEKQVQNLVNIGAWYNFHKLNSLRETPEHSFIFPPTVVNAFYNPIQNTITILAGILQYPFYSHNSLAALNYGGIGMVIGHEMTHGFDNTGRLYDKFGNLRQWWSNETITAYEKHAQCYIDQYDSYVPPELAEIGMNISINGKKTEGENIADNGGVREAFRAYQLYVERYGEEARLPGLEEFSPDHLFYLGIANEWCEHKSGQAVLMQLLSDVHSPGRFRVLGPLSNAEQFSKVWNCPSDSPMNRGDNRCILW
ncbi:neprilysin-1-like isoform X2 [Homarus americanus]|uniref:neprilysin-1-like isoform X2 n=1 Tax=Homarus americanus TaxID=6706 RepID=UPI001C45ACE5|nr:neprilysin-1-like isoform X2 [Homarus americanus]